MSSNLTEGHHTAATKNKYIHIHIDTYIHAYIYTHIYTFIHTDIYIYIYIYVHVLEFLAAFARPQFLQTLVLKQNSNCSILEAPTWICLDSVGLTWIGSPRLTWIHVNLLLFAWPPSDSLVGK